jgi:hypothetical protein
MSAIQTLFAFQREETKPVPVIGGEQLRIYDKIIVYLSGGKDSVACLLHLLEIGVNKERLEIWHHKIDPKGDHFMDWPCAPSYCQKLADELGLKVYFSWKAGGFRGELLRNNQPTKATSFETPSGQIETRGGQSNNLNTRRQFPQVSANLNERYCSPYLKIMVAEMALTQCQRKNVEPQQSRSLRPGRDLNPGFAKSTVELTTTEMGNFRCHR